MLVLVVAYLLYTYAIGDVVNPGDGVVVVAPQGAGAQWSTPARSPLRLAQSGQRYEQRPKRVEVLF